jgi:hypothetical protein
MTQEAPLGPKAEDDEAAAARIAVETATAAQTTAAAPDPAAPAPAPSPELAQLPQGVPAGELAATPYRTSLVPRAPVHVAPRRSAVGEALFVSGVLLWSFVVMGELTTSYAPGRHQMLVGEALAVVFVLTTTAATWGAAVRRNLALSPATAERAVYLRATAIAIAALMLWGLVVYVATAMGKAASRNVDGPITLMLLVLSLAGSLVGRRMAGLDEKAATARGRWLHRLLWTCAGLLTFAALVEILSS